MASNDRNHIPDRWSCEQIQTALPAWVVDEDARLQDAEVESHLERCQHCAKVLDECQAMLQLARRDVPGLLTLPPAVDIALRLVPGAEGSNLPAEKMNPNIAKERGAAWLGRRALGDRRPVAVGLVLAALCLLLIQTSSWAALREQGLATLTRFQESATAVLRSEGRDGVPFGNAKTEQFSLEEHQKGSRESETQNNGVIAGGRAGSSDPNAGAAGQDALSAQKSEPQSVPIRRAMGKQPDGLLPRAVAVADPVDLKAPAGPPADGELPSDPEWVAYPIADPAEPGDPEPAPEEPPIVVPPEEDDPGTGPVPVMTSPLPRPIPSLIPPITMTPIPLPSIVIPEPTADVPARVTGVVRDSNGVNVSDAMVYLEALENDAQGRFVLRDTDLSGRFELLVQPGIYWLWVEAKGFEPIYLEGERPGRRKVIRLSAGQSLREIEVVLSLRSTSEPNPTTGSQTATIPATLTPEPTPATSSTPPANTQQPPPVRPTMVPSQTVPAPSATSTTTPHATSAPAMTSTPLPTATVVPTVVPDGRKETVR